MTATQQTKQVKQILAGLLVRVRSDSMASMITGHSDELVRAKAKLEAAGFDVLWFGQSMLSAAL